MSIPTMPQRCNWLVLILALAACSAEEPAATPAQSNPATAPAAATTSEQLLAEAPANWQQTFATSAPGIRLVEYVPADTDPKDWTEKVSFESFSDAPLPDPLELVTSIANDQRKTCEKFEDHNTFSGLENGYPTAVQLFVCYANPMTRKGQLTLVKTIKGDDNFYVITRARRVPPIAPNGELPMPPKTMAEWSLYLRAISACNSADPAHPCPEATARSENAAASQAAAAPASK